MKNIINRLENLETLLKKEDDLGEKISAMAPEERRRRIAELVYMDGSYNGYVFKSPEEYDSMTSSEQSRYIAEVAEVMKLWVEERRRFNER